MSLVVTEGLHGAEVDGRFRGVYADTLRKRNPLLDLVMDIDQPSTHRMETYGYIEAAPHVEIWVDTVPEEGMGSKTFTCVNHKFGKRLKWKREDRADEMTRSLFPAVDALAKSAALLDERMFFDLILATTAILPATVNAADGVAFASATDAGSAARFGLSGGNIETGGGVATSAAVRDDFWAGLSRIPRFLDGKGQPLFGPEVLGSTIVVLYGAANEEVFREAFKQARTSDGSVAVSNTVLESGMDIRLWSTARITDNDWWIFATGVPHKPTFTQLREGLEDQVADASNSDMARSEDIEYAQVRIRKGAGAVLPYGSIKVNN